jgi:hypothetical protein
LDQAGRSEPKDALFCARHLIGELRGGVDPRHGCIVASAPLWWPANDLAPEATAGARTVRAVGDPTAVEGALLTLLSPERPETVWVRDFYELPAQIWVDMSSRQGAFGSRRDLRWL